MSYNPKNRKALFRKAKAQGELGYFEKAEKILEDLIKDAEPTGMLLTENVFLITFAHRLIRGQRKTHARRS